MHVLLPGPSSSILGFSMLETVDSSCRRLCEKSLALWKKEKALYWIYEAGIPDIITFMHQIIVFSKDY